MVKGRTAKNWLNLMLLIGGMASGAMGLVVLVGSYTHDVHLLQALQAVAPLQYNAALGFILCGAGLLFVAFGRRSLAIISGMAAAVGLFVLYFGFDQPGADLLSEGQFSLFQIPLVVGLLMAVLLALAVHFAQTASLRAQEAESINQELQTQIAERRQAEEALKASQDYARSIIDSSLDMIVAVDKDRKIIEFNQASQEAFGYSLEEVIGKHVNILYEDVKEGVAVHQKTVEKNQGIQEVFNRRKNGEVFPSFLSAAVLRDARGEEIGVMGISRDITDRKRAEEAIQRNLERIRTLHDIEMAIASTLDLGTVLHLFLEKIDRLFHYAAVTVSLVGSETGDLVPVACRNLNEREWKAEQLKGRRGISNWVIENKAPVIIRNIQTEARAEDAAFFRTHGLVSYLGVPLTARGEVLGVLGFYTGENHAFTNEEIEFLMTVAGQAASAIQNSQLYDEMKNLAGELAKSNRVKDEFLSVMSHELRTPLNVVVGYTGMVKDGMFGKVTDEARGALEKVLNRARDQLTMISTILEATRLEVEKVSVEIEEVKLEAFLEDLRSSYDFPLDKTITLEWEYPSDLPVVKTDPDKLKHVLQNLINNAIKFTEKGSVSVSAWYYPLARSVEFKVADTGIGIPKESQALVFEMFRQVDSSETRAYGGVGLGLYIVKKFTELLGGKVRVESNPGTGSVFHVKLPVEICPSDRKSVAA